MSEYSTALAFVLSMEGGYVDDEADRGGATNFGVTQSTYDRWRRNRGLPPRPVREIADDEVAEIYAGIWRQRRCDEMAWPLSVCHFDGSVNHGPVNAVRMLQRAVRVNDDGIHGPRTQAAIDRADPVRTTRELLWIRLRFYFDISTGSQIKFLRGWLRRAIELREVTAA